MSKRRERSGETVITVTSAQPGRSEDLDSRIVRYAAMMALRVACFVLAVFTPSPWRWMFVVGAVFLPYFAVVLANVARTATVRGGTPYDAPDRPAIEAAPGVVVQGEPVDEAGSKIDTEK
ncbi:DUF3099 domain-containing protein [Kribbella sandramycini]|uniref:DUF3099 domain-containing protein n=1 Tax=Kribbella sandramycini TaxID=60450 RepID=A0A7Y4KYS9_9ACTN|nr:DUF3099 domain-containing protein [Kribbella sandramycini]MBB6568973.1 hypothetical protein [Kribbella sandramycini]NOL41182.1 DUF3099 domain-containing protein [Kribbella sandramycini]